MTIRAVIWDLGGVILDVEDLAPRRELARSLGTTCEDMEELVLYGPSSVAAQRGEITVEKHWENILEALGLPASEMQTIRAGFWGRDRIEADLVDFIRSLRPEYTTVLLSNAFANLRALLEERWKIADLFDHLVISAEEGVAKPDPRIYRIALDRAGVAPAEAVFTDDLIENVEGARAVGMHALHYQNPEQVMADLGPLLAA